MIKIDLKWVEENCEMKRSSREGALVLEVKSCPLRSGQGPDCGMAGNSSSITKLK